MSSLDFEGVADVYEFAGEGDFLIRYRGPEIRHIIAGDVLNVRQGDPDPDQLVVIKGEDDIAALVAYEPGMQFEGVVVGLMRKFA